EAELTNTTAEDLLRGTVNVYLDDRFVGRTEITTVARGQTFVVGFGADPQLRTTRELLDRELTKQGGNQVVSFRYRLVLENYKDGELPVRVQDRTPYLNTSEQLRVTLGEMTDKLSEDPVYLRLERPRGILRWDITVPAAASGEKARMVEYGYRIEFDRNFHLRNPTGSNAEQQQREYEDLFRQKNKR
ncbi:MAG: DUF4139 domain-containing protein, partial [Phycisphaerae bacterium]|nr:DUF4139 domain-containing protein [Phycisphaerae bacterium]